MDMNRLTKAMRDSISEIFETMFFMPLEFPDETGLKDVQSRPDEPLVGAGIGFSGPFSGHLALIFPLSLSRELTANFLGEDESQLGQEEIEGTVKEILNMVAGKMLSLYDSSLVFQLEIPEIFDHTEIRKDGWGDGGQHFELFITTPETHFGAKLTLSS